MTSSDACYCYDALVKLILHNTGPSKSACHHSRLPLSDAGWEPDTKTRAGSRILFFPHWAAHPSARAPARTPILNTHGGTYSEGIRDKVFLESRLSDNGQELYPTRRMRVAKFSWNSGENLNFIWGDTVRRWWVRGSVIGREIVIAPARHSDTAQKVITFERGYKVTQPFTQPARCINPLSDLGSIWVGGGKKKIGNPLLLFFMEW